VGTRRPMPSAMRSTEAQRLVALRRMIRQRAANPLRRLVGAGRFELPTPCSRSKCATRLRYAPPDLVVQDFHWKASSRGALASRERRPYSGRGRSRQADL
jgi:hypothetical protein